MQDTVNPNTTAPFDLSALSVRPRKSPQAVQVLAIADATAASEQFSAGINHVLAILADRLTRSITKVDFGLVASRHADLGLLDECLLTRGDSPALRQALECLRFVGKGGPEGTQFWSVRDALSYPWEEGPMRRRAIVLLGAGDSKPVPGLPVQQLALELMRRRIEVFAVAPARANLRRLAELTDGLFFELNNQPAPQEVQRVVQRLTASMTQTLTGGVAIASRVTNRGALGTGAVCAALDCSSSMGGAKLASAKIGLLEMARSVASQRMQVGLVSFGSDASLRAQVGCFGELFIREVQALEAAGGTNMADGIERAIAALDSSPGRRVIILVTDGFPNDRGAALDAGRRAREAGVEIWTIGTPDADNEFLRSIAWKASASTVTPAERLDQGILLSTASLLGHR